MFEIILSQYDMFLEEYSIHYTPFSKKTTVKYTVMQYDVIDADLEFDEMEYKVIIQGLDDAVLTHAQDTTEEVEIVKTRLVYRDFREEEFKINIAALGPGVVMCSLDV